MKLKKSLLLFLCGLMGCVDAGNSFPKPLHDVSGDADSVIDSDSDSDDFDIADFYERSRGALYSLEHGETAGEGGAGIGEVAGRGEGVAVVDHVPSPMNLSGEQRDQLVVALGEDLAGRYLGVTAATKDVVREEIIVISREKNPDAYKDALLLAQLDISLDLFVMLNSGKKSLDKTFLRRMALQAQAMQNKVNEDSGAGAGASPTESMRAGILKVLLAEDSTDFDRFIAPLMLVRLDRFERESPRLKYLNPLALCDSDRSLRSCSMHGLQDLLDASDDMDVYADFFKALGCAAVSIGMAHQRGESLPADAVLFLMGGAGLAAPRLSLVPINEWTSEYLSGIARAARSEDLSAGVSRYSAAQSVLEAGHALLSAGDSFTIVSAQTLRLSDAIEKYLALRGSSSSLVPSRR